MKAQRAILYARVSTPQQAKLYSLDDQIEQERRYAAEIGAVVVAEIRDDQSGRKMQREGLERAREMLAADDADILITWKIDRLHRNYVNSVMLRDELRRLGKELHYAQSRTKSGETALERLPEEMQYIFGEIEADFILDRTSKGRQKKAAAGKWVGLNRPPFGYLKAGEGKEAALVPDVAPQGATIRLHSDLETGEIVRLIFSWYAVGDERGGPLNTLQIANRLSAAGIPTPQDRIPSRAALKKRGYAEWSRNTVHKILRHDAYSGTFYQFKYKAKGDGSKQSRKNQNRDEWQPIEIPALVERSLWDAAQSKLDKGRELSQRNQTVVNEYLVARHIVCGCGYKMRASTSMSGKAYAAQAVKNYKPFSYYRCPGRRADNANHCTMKTLNAKTVDARTWEWVKEELANPAAVERKLREQRAQQGSQGAQKEAELAALYAHRVEIENEMRRIARLRLPEHILNEMLEGEDKKLRLTLAEIEKVEAQAVTPITEERIQTVVQFSEDLQQRLGALERSFEGRRRVIEGMGVKVDAREIDGAVWLAFSSDIRPGAADLRTLLPTF